MQVHIYRNQFSIGLKLTRLGLLRVFGFEFLDFEHMAGGTVGKEPNDLILSNLVLYWLRVHFIIIVSKGHNSYKTKLSFKSKLEIDCFRLGKGSFCTFRVF